jgi:hypothetical protein
MHLEAKASSAGEPTRKQARGKEWGRSRLPFSEARGKEWREKRNLGQKRRIVPHVGERGPNIN